MLAWMGVRKAFRLAYAASGVPGVSSCPEIPEGCIHLVVACRMVVLIEARRMGRSEVSFPSPYARRASPLPRAPCCGRLTWSANERTRMVAIDWFNNPPTCEDCGGTIRPPHSSEQEYPGTRPYGGKGTCNSCYRNRKRTTGSSAVDWGIEQCCVTCGCKMRPSRASVVDWPGTRLYSSRGRCSICVKGGRSGNPTVRELFEQGHPCIEPAPLPSNKRSNIW